jgi:hypothetical protein
LNVESASFVAGEAEHVASTTTATSPGAPVPKQSAGAFLLIEAECHYCPGGRKLMLFAQPCPFRRASAGRSSCSQSRRFDWQQGKHQRRNVVGNVDYDINVNVAKCEIKRFNLSANTFDGLIPWNNPT